MGCLYSREFRKQHLQYPPIYVCILKQHGVGDHLNICTDELADKASRWASFESWCGTIGEAAFKTEPDLF